MNQPIARTSGPAVSYEGETMMVCIPSYPHPSDAR